MKPEDLAGRGHRDHRVGLKMGLQALLHDPIVPEIEWSPRRTADGLQLLDETSPGERQRARMAEGIVAWTAEQDMRRPGEARPAAFGERTCLAETP